MADRDLRGTILAGELAVVEDDYDRAEDALIAALGEVRKRKGGRRDAGD